MILFENIAIMPLYLLRFRVSCLMTKRNCGIYSNQKIHAVDGVLTEQTGSTENSYLYSGEQFDPDLDQYYLCLLFILSVNKNSELKDGFFC